MKDGRAGQDARVDRAGAEKSSDCAGLAGSTAYRLRSERR